MTDVLVIGACQAGVQVACTLRDLGHAGQVTLVGAEQHLPYQRPPLSKAYLLGTATADSLALRTRQFYLDQRIDLRLGLRVTELDLDAGKAITSVGEVLQFDAVALTTGARARRLSVPGGDLPGVLVLRCVDDADQLATALLAATHVVVVGGGFVGLEAAAVCRSKGLTVTVVEATARLLSRAVAPIVSDFYAVAHQKRGATILLGRTVLQVLGTDRVTAVVLDDGTEIAADLVLVGIGVLPRVELAELAGIVVDGGIVVDSCSRTSHPSVVAAGDVAIGPSPQDPSMQVRLESVQNAVDQGKCAASTLTGRPTPNKAIPWFWSEQSDLRLQTAGLSLGYDEVVVRGNLLTEAFSALYLREGQVIAVDSVNRPADYMAVRRSLGRGPVPAPSALDDVNRSLKDLLA